MLRNIAPFTDLVTNYTAKKWRQFDLLTSSNRETLGISKTNLPSFNVNVDRVFFCFVIIIHFHLIVYVKGNDEEFSLQTYLTKPTIDKNGI